MILVCLPFTNVDQKINGKSFLRLPLNKKTFEDEVRQTVTIGGWDNIVDLIMEARKGDLYSSNHICLELSTLLPTTN